MIGNRLVPLLGLATVLAASPAPEPSPAGGPGRTLVVRMLDDRYEPAEIEVRIGDVVHFVQEGGRAHNVEFRGADTPEGFDFGPNRRGPYFKEPGSVYEVRIDERFEPGNRYPFICTPHALMGMKGAIRVEP